MEKTASGELESRLAEARAKGPRALIALGKRLLVGESAPAAPERAVEVLREAAASGASEAAALLSVCAAWSVGQSRNLEQALERLEQAARLGWEPAQQELRLLARQAGDDWSSLLRAVSVPVLAAPPPARLVRERPRIMVLERFLTQAECKWLIRRGAPHLARARVYRGSASAQTADTRTNREASFTIFSADVLQSVIRDRIAAATHAPLACFEVAKLLHYEPGQQFALHGDFIQTTTPELVREVQLRGQRAATFLVYLNEEYEGGETEFPRLNFRFRGVCGDALLFSNIDSQGAPDYDAVHAGLPPMRGEKWVFSQWIRTRPLR